MKKFLDEDFLLQTKTAKTLYNNYAKNQPIVDYHCHVSPQEIYEDKSFENITQMWLYGDHYKWRFMRANAIDEKYITGDASDYDKFCKFAEVLSRGIGNPMYHWCHLELKRFFGYDGVLNSKTADTVWNFCNEKLKKGDLTVRNLITKSNVTFIGTTDDPTDSLIYHEKIKEDKSFKVTVAPSFRPDKAVNIDKAGFKEYILKLSDVCGFKITSVKDVKKALADRVAFFDKHGCKSSDHGVDYMPFEMASEEEIEKTFEKAMNGEKVSQKEADAYKTALIVECGKLYHKYNWVMQWHYNCLRNPNTAKFNTLGPDTGYDSVNGVACAGAVAKMLDELEKTDELPKTVVYSLNPNDNEMLDSIVGAFQDSSCLSKVQHGCAWWFNDTKPGIEKQLISYASIGVLGNFIGMLTDSRSFLSYTRHEYFRRILCNIIGNWIENGEYDDDIETVGKLVSDISYNNAVKYFNI